MFEILNFAGRAVAGEHDLLVRLVQRVERVEKFLLNALLARQKLDVVNQQHVGLAVFLAKPGELVVLDGVNVLVGEFFGRNIGDARALLVAGDVLADGVEQVGFAEADAAVEKKWIIGFAGSLGDGQRGGVGKIVVIADDKGFERVLGIKTDFPVVEGPFVAGLGGSGGFAQGGSGGRQGLGVATGGDLEFYLQLAPGRDGQGILQQAQIIVLEPDLAEFVGHLQGDVVGIDRVGAQRGKPHVVSFRIQPGTNMFPC